MTDENEFVVIHTLCSDWSCNYDKESQKNFWWNNTYGISVWADALKVDKSDADATDTDVWRKFIEFQIKYVFKLCPICREPEGAEDMKICCYCASTVHKECSVEATPEKIAWKPANKGYERHLCVCFQCEDIPFEPKKTSDKKHASDSVRHALRRILTLRDELPVSIFSWAEKAAKYAAAGKSDAQLSGEVANTMQSFFQSESSLKSLQKSSIASKGNGIGVVACCDIPAFNIIGVYPGYDDMLSGEQAKLGRPVPKYALMNLNCADYYNDVFAEFQNTFTPFINEPSENEVSNCAWIQEPMHVNGRLSIMTVKDVRKGEELLIGYGPLYSRNYPYCYDAYALHLVEGSTQPHCFALWHWPTLEETDAEFVCNIIYDPNTNTYVRSDSLPEVQL